MPRVRLEDDNGGSYFTSRKENISFMHSGCKTLDCVLGGGWPLGRVSNIVGDKSTGKTALACEAATNFLNTYDGVVAYRDVESAFDVEYAQAMGLPTNVDFGDEENPIQTIEQFYDDYSSFLDENIKKNKPGLYIIDSLDALSDEEELKRDIRKGTYGGDKQKKLGEIFRRLTNKTEKSKTHLMVISQIRENINAMFGEKYRRSGGKSLDFYASQQLWLAQIKTLKITRKGISRPNGILIKAKCKKNKVGLPFRETEFQFIFSYGIDDLESSVKFLEQTKSLSAIGVNQTGAKNYLKEVEGYNNKKYRKEIKRVSKIVEEIWYDVETSFLPKRKKY